MSRERREQDRQCHQRYERDGNEVGTRVEQKAFKEASLAPRWSLNTRQAGGFRAQEPRRGSGDERYEQETPTEFGHQPQTKLGIEHEGSTPTTRLRFAECVYRVLSFRRHCRLFFFVRSLCSLLLDLIENRRIQQRGHIAELSLLRHVLQKPAHDLAGAGLRKVVGEDDGMWPGDLSDDTRHVISQLFGEVVVALDPGLGCHEGGDRLAFAVGRLRPTTAASATDLWSTRALSTSYVERR